MKTNLFFALVCLLFSCESAPTNFEGGVPARDESETELVPVARFAEEEDPQSISTDRQLIKKGYLNISVKDVDEAKTEIEKICKEDHAYVSSETRTDYKDRLEYEKVIRVPSARFDEFVEKIERLSKEIKAKHVETSDVTEEMIDNEARIKTKRELENRYREILKQAKQVSDILSIEAQLNHVRADIESMEGRLNYLRNQVSFSTLTLSYYQPVVAEFGYVSKTIEALGSGWSMFLIFMIAVLQIWPFLVIGTGVLFFILRKKTRQKKETGAASQ